MSPEMSVQTVPWAWRRYVQQKQMCEIQIRLPQRQTRHERKHELKDGSINPKNTNWTGGWVIHTMWAEFLSNGKCN